MLRSIEVNLSSSVCPTLERVTGLCWIGRNANR